MSRTLPRSFASLQSLTSLRSATTQGTKRTATRLFSPESLSVSGFSNMASELENAWAARGAEVGSVLGCPLPLHFGNVEAEWRALRESCGVFDASFRRLIAASGEDRVSFLQGMLSNDIKVLVPGSGCAALQLNVNGKIVSSLRVYAEPEQIWLDVFTSCVDRMIEAFNRYLVADDVELNVSDVDAPLFGIEGPASAKIL